MYRASVSLFHFKGNCLPAKQKRSVGMRSALQHTMQLVSVPSDQRPAFRNAIYPLVVSKTSALLTTSHGACMF